jgi:ABC-2 type transport system ATP-binding protein
VIRTHALTKHFGSVTAVDDVALDVRPGDIYGFLGANGSGKTTTMRMVLGLVLATSGTIELLGRPIPRDGREVLGSVGALVEAPAAYGHLSGRTNLRLLDASARAPRGAASRRRRVDEALEQVGLAGVGSRPVRAYSTGMRQRLGLAAALVRPHELLVLDEPTNGLDPQGIREIRELLVRLHAAGTTIFLSSHLLAEVEALCTRVGVLDQGRLVLEEELESLRAPTGRTIVRTPDPASVVAMLDGKVEGRDGDRLVIQATDPAELNARLVASGIPVLELGPERRSLEDVVNERTAGAGDRVDGMDGRGVR